jgi:hypothetical protein
MIVRAFPRALAVALVLGAGLSVISTSANAACRGTVSAAGGAKSIQYWASASSKYAWKDKVKDRYGAKFSTWSSAKSKNVDCSKSGPNKKWVCVASARPCG